MVYIRINTGCYISQAYYGGLENCIDVVMSVVTLATPDSILQCPPEGEFGIGISSPTTDSEIASDLLGQQFLNSKNQVNLLNK